MKKSAPNNLTHKPIVTIDYEKKDFGSDAKFLTIGRSTWDSEDFSAKIWRWAEDGERWSRQSEELPLRRSLDLATLVISVIMGKQSELEEFVQNENEIDDLKSFIKENMNLFSSKLAEIKRLLENSTTQKSSLDSPNIFDFATSELSQDALFAWLIMWADPKYKNKDAKLHFIAQDFVRMLIGKNDFVIDSINVGRQWKNIDVWVEINTDTFLVIEDKTNTTIHDNQLLRYKDIVKQEYEGKRCNLYYSYIKTANEPLAILSDIEKMGYRCVSRKDLIKCLDNYHGNNTIINCYLDHLKEIDSLTQSFKNLPVSEWDWYAMQGFFKELENKLDLKNWGYVSNPQGGFLGAWWHFTPFKKGEMYLQFEEDKLCFKIWYDGESNNRSKVRLEQHNKLMALATKENRYEIQKPVRFGAGEYMTIAVVDSAFLFGKGIINIENIIRNLLFYQNLIDTCCNS